MSVEHRVPEAMETCACPLCGSREAGKIVGTRGRFGVAVTNVVCPVCALVYVNPRPTREAMAAYYAEEYEKAIRLYDQVLALDSGNTRAAEQREKARLTLLSRLQPPDTRIPAEARSRYRRARSYLAAGDYASAEAALKEAIKTLVPSSE